MTTHEFDILMNIVYSRWGAKAYPAPVKERIWFFVKDLPQKSFESMIYALLDSSRYAPMPQEFKMLSYGEKERLGLRGNKEPETQPSKIAKCWDCGDSGNLFARHKEKHTTATFRCHCHVGRSRPGAQGSLWSRAFEGTYTLEPVYDKALGNWVPTKDQPLEIMVREMRSLLRAAESGKSRKHSGELKPIGSGLSALIPPPGSDPEAS